MSAPHELSRRRHRRAHCREALARGSAVAGDETSRPVVADFLARGLAIAALAFSTVCAAAPDASDVDPLESFNRAMFEVNEVADAILLKPAAEVYVAVFPQPIRTAFANVLNNIDDFFSGVNGLLQGKTEKAGNDFGRVLINTFVMGGIFDVASDLGIERGGEDFGQTFGAWGFPAGPYLFLPVIGPTSVRDGIGLIPRIYLGPANWMDVPLRNSLWGFTTVEIRASASDVISITETAALDKYNFIRSAYLQRREYQVYDGKPPKKEEDE